MPTSQRKPFRRNRLREVRNKRRLTQTQLGQKVGRLPSHICAIEGTEDPGDLRLRTCQDLAIALKVPITRIFPTVKA